MRLPAERVRASEETARLIRSRKESFKLARWGRRKLFPSHRTQTKGLNRLVEIAGAAEEPQIGLRVPTAFSQGPLVIELKRMLASATGALALIAAPDLFFERGRNCFSGCSV